MHSFLLFLHSCHSSLCVPSFPASLSLGVFKLLNVGCSAQSIGLRDTAAEKRERERERVRGALSQCLQMNTVPRARQTGSSSSISNPDSTISLTLQPSTTHVYFFIWSPVYVRTHTDTPDITY